VAKEEIGMYRGYPLAVLTNGYTASAGELFTAALSEYELATIVGTNTYGKGVIQTIFDLSQMGYSGGLKLTIGYYAPPSGTHYDKVGIAPDIEVALDASLAGKNLYLVEEQEDNQLLAAIEAVAQTES
jgi:carboxyl-terminal processing protease